MLVTNHVLSGALIGASAHGPGQAFALGVASHFALDSVPHWGNWRDREQFLRVAVRDGLTGLTVMGAVTATAPAGKRLAMLAGMTGAALPDLDKPWRLVFGRSPWPGFVNRFHRGIQHESLSWSPVEVAVATVFGATLLAVILNSQHMSSKRIMAAQAVTS
jgi:hypothetical protein